jgi:hypothetical protein
MSSLLFDTARRLVHDESFARRSTTVGLAVVLLLLALVVQRELVRALGGEHERARIQSFGVAIGPLLVAFLLIAGVRYVHLL